MTSSETIFGLAGLLAPLVLACLVFVIWRQRRGFNSRPANNVPTRALNLIPWVRLFAAEDFLLLAGRPALRHRLRRNRNRVARLYLRDLERHCPFSPLRLLSQKADAVFTEGRVRPGELRAEQHFFVPVNVAKDRVVERWPDEIQEIVQHRLPVAPSSNL